MSPKGLVEGRGHYRGFTTEWDFVRLDVTGPLSGIGLERPYRRPLSSSKTLELVSESERSMCLDNGSGSSIDCSSGSPANLCVRTLSKKWANH